MSVEDPNYYTIAEDIRYLQRTWTGGASDAELRRGSAILRRFLVDGGQGLLFRAWREYGFSGQPTIVGPDLRASAGDDLSIIVLGLAGGGNVGGTYSANIVLNKGPETVEPLPVEDGTTSERNWRLLDFIEAPSIIVAGETVSRREVVKFFANYLGGVHQSDRVRKGDEEMVERIRKIGGVVEAFRKEGMMFELLSIGQLVVGSEDIDRLAEAIERRKKRRASDR